MTFNKGVHPNNVKKKQLTCHIFAMITLQLLFNVSFVIVSEILINM